MPKVNGLPPVLAADLTDAASLLVDDKNGATRKATIAQLRTALNTGPQTFTGAVTMDTTLSVTGALTVNGANSTFTNTLLLPAGARVIGSGLGIEAPSVAAGAGWSRAITFANAANKAIHYLLGHYGEGTAFIYGYLGLDYNDTMFRFWPNSVVTVGNITARGASAQGDLVFGGGRGPVVASPNGTLYRMVPNDAGTAVVLTNVS